GIKPRGPPGGAPPVHTSPGLPACFCGEAMFEHIQIPAQGKKITVNADYSLTVQDNPIVSVIEGDGTGVDITPVMIKVVDAAVAKAYGGRRKIAWMELYAGEKATKVYGPD